MILELVKENKEMQYDGRTTKRWRVNTKVGNNNSTTNNNNNTINQKFNINVFLNEQCKVR